MEGKGTREQIVNIRIVIEKCRDQNRPLYMCFIDYAKAFDCVSHRKLWETMEQMGFPVHIIQLIVNLYKEQESVVRTSNGDTEWFKIERRVRQGCVISPGLYNIYSEHIMRCVLEEHHDGITIGGRRQNNLRFADDTTCCVYSLTRVDLDCDYLHTPCIYIYIYIYVILYTRSIRSTAKLEHWKQQ